MCFGSKKKLIQDDDDDDAPRQANGQFPAQPTYAPTAAPSDPPKSSIPPQYHGQPQSPQSPQSAQQQQQQYYGTSPGKQPHPPAAELSGTTEFAPPPGPPPSKSQSQPQPGSAVYGDDFAPPPGPPPPKPGGSLEPKQQHDWEAAVPDTSLFPPPPALFSGFYRSPTSNASEEESRAGEAWCEQYPLFAPQAVDAQGLAAVEKHDLSLITPVPTYRGTLARTAPGAWTGRTSADSADACIMAYPPAYLVRNHSPLLPLSAGTRTIYYEVRIIRLGPEASVALGYAALPYPSFRMPGWHRGSLAVHSDDGHRYINDTWGGKAFTAPFRAGETVGIGMTFSVSDSDTRIRAEVFVTREGGRRREGWDLHEEGDSVEDRAVTGLEGFHDLSIAVGTYKDVEFEVVLDPKRWVAHVPGA